VVLYDGSIWSTVGSVIAPGGSVGAYDISDTFPHGMKTTYFVQVVTDFKECKTANNQLSYTIDEAQLHPQKSRTCRRTTSCPRPLL